MANLDPRLVALARRHYERGRARSACIRALPLLPLIGAAYFFERAILTTALAGAGMLAVSVVMHWRSAALGKSVFPGVALGLIPMVAMRAAQSYGHHCVPGACWSLCIPACIISGLSAGLVLGRFERDARSPSGAWVGGAALVFLTGSLACGCVGVGGLLGLALGVALGLAPAAVTAARAQG